MKKGRDLQELAAEITRQRDAKRDYVAPTTALAMVVENGHFEPDGSPDQPKPLPKCLLDLQDTGRFGINSLAHSHIQSHVNIPAQYYNRMLSQAPELLAKNVNHWFRTNPAPRMVRTLDERVRALLSNSYRPLDNYDFAEAILPVLRDRHLEVMSCEVTEKKLYIKAVDMREVKVPVGYKMGDGSHRIFDVCAPAFIASNSEVGYGRLVLETGVYTRACTNLAWWAEGGMKRTHLGSRHAVTEGVENIDALLSARTKQKTDEALWLQVRDVMKAAFDEGFFKKRCERLTATSEQRITGKVELVVASAAERFGLTEVEKDGVLKHLIEGGKLSQYGLHAAFTRAAADVDDYDRSTEMEYMGGRIIELPRTDWAVLNEAA